MMIHSNSFRCLVALTLTLAIHHVSLGFYFPGGPGDGLTRRPRLTNPCIPPLQPEFEPIAQLMPPRATSQALVPPDPQPPEKVPEPTTLALALLGASGLGCRLAWKRL